MIGNICAHCGDAEQTVTLQVIKGPVGAEDIGAEVVVCTPSGQPNGCFETFVERNKAQGYRFRAIRNADGWRRPGLSRPGGR